ncbi:MAG: hypothetical protein LW832_06320 [Parachlamydia sp.]|jgi:hypothetical protein|nr:hypothetical protein [Parachlamydia sp.]
MWKKILFVMLCVQAWGNSAEIDPPRLPKNFSWKGRYVVPDLNINVPFTWNGNEGNIQMVAGGQKHPIYFTNLIYTVRG